MRNPSLSVPVTVTCRLSPSSSDTDKTSQSLAARLPSTIGTEGELAVSVAHKFAATSTLAFECRGDSAGGFAASDVQLVAIQAGQLIRQPLGGAATSSGSGSPVIDAGFRTSSVAVPQGATLTKIASLPLSAGKWYVVAKASVSDLGRPDRVSAGKRRGRRVHRRYLRPGGCWRIDWHVPGATVSMSERPYMRLSRAGRTRPVFPSSSSG